MKLSIIVVTYNQENYIRQCLDSILAQKVDVDYEVIIADDCSKDITGTICDEYAQKHTHFKVYHHPKNIGLLKNWEFVMNKCEGEYVAILEGDDYWIDDHKLQKQIAFLDAHPDFSAVFTRAKIHYMDGATEDAERLLPNLEEREYTEREMCEHFYVLSSSIMFRNCLRPIHYSKQLLYADIYTFIRLFHAGRVYCIGEQTTAYRIHKKNLSRQGDGQFYIDSFNMCRYFIKHFPEVADIYQKRLESCLPHMMYDKSISAWKYRLYYIYLHPKMLFSRFFIKTIKSYILPF